MKLELDDIDRKVALEAFVMHHDRVMRKISKMRAEGKPINIYLIQRQRTLLRFIQTIGAEIGVQLGVDGFED